MKYIKPIVAVVILVGAGYVSGSYYAKYEATKKVDATIVNIKKHNPNINNIAYNKISASLFSLWQHAFVIEGLKLQLKAMPENPIIIDQLKLSNYRENKNNIPQSFDIAVDNMHIYNASASAYETLKNSLKNQHLGEKQSKAVLELMNKSFAKYFDTNLNLELKYTGSEKDLQFSMSTLADKNQYLNLNFALNKFVMNKPLSYNLDNYKMAINEAKLSSFNFNLKINDLFDGNKIVQQMPNLKMYLTGISPSIHETINYDANTEKLVSSFNLSNYKKPNIVYSFSTNAVKLGNYGISDLTKASSIRKAFADATFNNVNINLDLNHEVNLAPLMTVYPKIKILKNILGKDNYALIFNYTADINAKTLNGYGKIKLGVQDYAALSASMDNHFKQNLPFKEMIYPTFDYILKSKKSDNNLFNDQFLKYNKVALQNNEFKNLTIEFKNTGLMQALLNFGSQMTKQKPELLVKQAKRILEASLAPYEQRVLGAKKSIKAISLFLDNPNNIVLKITPKEEFTSYDELNLIAEFNEKEENYNVALDKLKLARQQAYSDLQNALAEQKQEQNRKDKHNAIDGKQNSGTLNKDKQKLAVNNSNTQTQMTSIDRKVAKVKQAVQDNNALIKKLSQKRQYEMINDIETSLNKFNFIYTVNGKVIA